MAPESDQARVRLLVADPSQEFYVWVRLLLEEIAPRQFDVQWACTYGQTVTKLLDVPHVVCLASFQIGRRSGLELIRELRSVNCQTPVLLIGSPDELAELPATLAFDYLDRSRLSASLLYQAIREAALLRPKGIASPRSVVPPAAASPLRVSR